MNINKLLFRFIKIAFTLMIVLLIVYAFIRLGTTAYDFGYRVFTESAMEEEPGTDVLVQVKSGMSGRELGQLLEKKGLVRDANLFYLQLRLSAYNNRIHSGTYTLNTSMTPKEMIMEMAQADSDTEQTEDTQEPEAATEVTTGGE